MTEGLSPKDVAILIRSRQILKAKGLKKDADVKSICEAAGISRKTGYQWANNFQLPAEQNPAPSKELQRLQREHEDLKKRCERLESENEGRRIAWEIHGVDELLAAKKNTTNRGKKKKR